MFVPGSGDNFRKCNRCGESKPAEAFACRERGQRDTFCRPCRKRRRPMKRATGLEPATSSLEGSRSTN
jgi:recombinational DNA repair protein (RecF pathway)